jgi:hypothetical protein
VLVLATIHPMFHGETIEVTKSLSAEWEMPAAAKMNLIGTGHVKSLNGKSILLKFETTNTNGTTTKD